MALLIAFILGVASLVFVLYPLYHHRRASGGRSSAAGDKSRGPLILPAINRVNDNQGNSSVDVHATLTQDSEEQTQLAEREQLARTALQEAELDYQLGNIAETDYRSLRERYMRRALVALKSRYDREQEIDDEIEKTLREMKERNTNATQ